MELTDALDAVHDAESFLKFARLLTEDREHAAQLEKKGPKLPYGVYANGWANSTIETFLDAAVRWAEESRFGMSQGVTTDNPWKQFAFFLFCGKIDE